MGGGGGEGEGHLSIAYASAGLGVVHDLTGDGGQQTFFEGHANDITCITVNKEGALA